MQRFVIGVEEAIERIQRVRNVCPNNGFREQLQVYLDCNFVANTSKAAYRHWRLRQDARFQKGTLFLIKLWLTLDVTGEFGKPDVINYATADTVVHDPSGTPTIDLRCKKCRYSLLQLPLIVDEY